MILLDMSKPSEFDDKFLTILSNEIIEHLKSKGFFDKVRMDLIDPIVKDPDFEEVKRKYEAECDEFCGRVDLGQSRGELRKKLADWENKGSSSGRLLKNQISKLLKERDEDIRSLYCDHASSYLTKFLPAPSISPEEKSDYDSQQDQHADDDDDDDDMDIDDDDIERPTYSPIGNDASCDSHFEEVKPKVEEATTVNETYATKTTPELSLQDIPIPLEGPSPTEGSPQREGTPPTEEPPPMEGAPPLPPDENSEDTLEQLTLSSVSSVRTNDIDDFDMSIKLSDDEADIVGKPKNSKVPVEVIQGQIDLQAAKIELKPYKSDETIPRNEGSVHEKAESDSGLGENTPSKTGTVRSRPDRARKSNPRYSTEHYKLL